MRSAPNHIRYDLPDGVGGAGAGPVTAQIERQQWPRRST